LTWLPLPYSQREADYPEDRKCEYERADVLGLGNEDVHQMGLYVARAHERDGHAHEASY
jgi:hypothetical protein